MLIPPLLHLGRWLPRSPLASVTLALVSLAFIGWIDRLAGWEISLFVIYAIPILIVVRGAGLGTVVIFVLLCTVVWWAVNAAELPYQTHTGYLLATLSRFIYFSVVAISAIATKAHVDADRERIAALERARMLEGDIVRASESEQRRIGQDLHDGLCQELAAVGCAARSLADDLSESNPRAADEAVEIESMLKQAVVHTRDLARGIFPVQMDGGGLAVALGEMAAALRKTGGVDVSFHDSGDVLIDDSEVAMNFYRIAQEAVRNAMRHSGATTITISLDHDGDRVRLTVVDNGRGLSADAESHPGMGLKTMRRRATAMGADIEFGKSQSGGTLVSCAIRRRTIE